MTSSSSSSGEVEVGSRGPYVAGEPRPPVGRGGAVAASVSPFEAIVLCGSDHSDGEELLVPHVLKVVLTS
eukprot:scaffold10933_cov51-Phaeocystis_antarctica.AAC.1